MYEHFNMKGQRFYTFKPKDGVRFFALDSTYMSGEQLQWLDKELKLRKRMEDSVLPSSFVFVRKDAWP